MYNIVLVLARTRLLFAVARREHGQDPEVELYHLPPLLGAFQVGTVWQREQLGRVVSVDSFTFPVLSATELLLLLFSYLMAVSSKFLPQPVLFTVCPS